MLTNKSTKQERSNYSNEIHAYSVIKKPKKKIHFGAQIIAAGAAGKRNSFTRRQSLRRPKDL